jgi:hypothetical protein
VGPVGAGHAKRHGLFSVRLYLISETHWARLYRLLGQAAEGQARSIGVYISAIIPDVGRNWTTQGPSLKWVAITGRQEQAAVL